jgi:hypothetical protein
MAERQYNINWPDPNIEDENTCKLSECINKNRLCKFFNLTTKRAFIYEFNLIENIDYTQKNGVINIFKKVFEQCHDKLKKNI